MEPYEDAPLSLIWIMASAMKSSVSKQGTWQSTIDHQGMGYVKDVKSKTGQHIWTRELVCAASTNPFNPACISVV